MQVAKKKKIAMQGLRKNQKVTMKEKFKKNPYNLRIREMIYKTIWDIEDSFTEWEPVIADVPSFMGNGEDYDTLITSENSIKLWVRQLLLHLKEEEKVFSQRITRQISRREAEGFLRRDNKEFKARRRGRGVIQRGGSHAGIRWRPGIVLPNQRGRGINLRVTPNKGSGFYSQKAVSLFSL